MIQTNFTYKVDKNNYNVTVLIVLYYPDKKNIDRLLQQLISESVKTVFIDNTPDYIDGTLDHFSKNTNNSIFYLPLNENIGIAEAQNIGIRKAKKIAGTSHVLFLDQDSQIEKGFINRMINEYERVSKLEHNIAALGPIPINQSSMEPYKQEKKLETNIDLRYHRTSALISSGMLVEICRFEDVGLMDSTLFIDSVDFEWCWRAKSKGYDCYITEQVSLLHKVGKYDQSFLGFPIIISSPQRYYYQYRNFLKLFRRGYVPSKWKINSLVRRLFYLVYFPFFTANGIKSLSYMLKGILAGLKDN